MSFKQLGPSWECPPFLWDSMPILREGLYAGDIHYGARSSCGSVKFDLPNHLKWVKGHIDKQLMTVFLWDPCQTPSLHG